MSEVKWTAEQVEMFARENKGRKVRGRLPVTRREQEGVIKGAEIESSTGVPSIFLVCGWLLDPSTVTFLDGKPETAPPLPGDLCVRDEGITWCGVRDDGYQCTRPVGHPPTVHVAHTHAGQEVRRWSVGVGRFSLPKDATDPRFAAVKPQTVAERRVADPRAEYRRIVASSGPAPGQPVASDDAVFLGHVDELLRWAQGHTDRDLLRDRVCRALGPLLRERMGRKLG